MIAEKDEKPALFNNFSDIKVEEPPRRKVYICKSKRKIKPTVAITKYSLEETVQLIDSNSADCHSYI
jgi:hypothetical protein